MAPRCKKLNENSRKPQVFYTLLIGVLEHVGSLILLFNDLRCFDVGLTCEMLGVSMFLSGLLESWQYLDHLKRKMWFKPKISQTTGGSFPLQHRFPVNFCFPKED